MFNKIDPLVEFTCDNWLLPDRDEQLASLELAEHMHKLVTKTWKQMDKKRKKKWTNRRLKQTTKAEVLTWIMHRWHMIGDF